MGKYFNNFKIFMNKKESIQGILNYKSGKLCRLKKDRRNPRILRSYYFLFIFICLYIYSNCKFFQFPMTALREIKILKQISHKNLIKLHEICTSNGYFILFFLFLF